MNSESNVVIITTEELDAKIAEILEKYPFLETFEPECCRGHAEDDLREQYGWETARAWLELEAARFLRDGP